jgi:hypothetical protein
MVMGMGLILYKVLFYRLFLNFYLFGNRVGFLIFYHYLLMAEEMGFPTRPRLAGFHFSSHDLRCNLFMAAIGRGS